MHDNYKNFFEFSNYVDDLAEDEYGTADNVLPKQIKSVRKENVREREMERVLELHKRLWEEKLRVKRDHFKLDARKIVRDLINHAMKICDFRREFHEDPSQKILDEWKSLFIKELPVLREPKSFVNRLLEEDPVENPAILKTVQDDARIDAAQPADLAQTGVHGWKMCNLLKNAATI
ncbi:hypothetical protein GE061_006026 [Apolygus lucorum]|uniref:CPC1/SPEF2 domain-containing protein n=1 Tax=Apolygus lucorum TaxID=248454 RepID=A0A8S9WUG7_APOLU|nr:hypothetical protein GE061_006026 [Apolygus lucorum]